MVFFTCNHCGESAKKAAVEKHYNFKCRGAPVNVSCMDCMKDFHGEEYVAHTKCITEAEKYSGKDYVAKDSKNSGAKKQESWMDIIRSILETEEYKLSAAARSEFQRLQSFDNVPRKKAKFLNFVKNCMRMPLRPAQEVWNVLEKELEKIKLDKQKSAEASQGTAVKPSASITNGKDEKNEQDKAVKSKKETKKAAKSKLAENNGEEIVEKATQETAAEPLACVTNGEDTLNDQENEVKSKKEAKKAKKRKLAESNCVEIATKVTQGTLAEPSASLTNGNDKLNDQEKEAKSKKKQTKKAAKLILAESNGIETAAAKVTQGTAAASSASVANKITNLNDQEKKVKSKNKEAKKVAKRDLDESSVLEAPATKKSKKQKTEAVATAVEENSVVGAPSAVVENGNEEQQEFVWSEALKKIVDKHAEGITLEKLKEKLLKKYTAKLKLTEALTQKQQKKFEKKFATNLKKCSELQLADNVVRSC